ncbi:unnamed protein product, partial [marine sediment metagenome]
YLKTNKCDYIIATSEPFILFRYAKKLSNEFKIPWIADYRDSWSTNYNILHNKKLVVKLITKYCIQYFEKKLIKNTLFVITTAAEYKEKLSKIHPKKEVHIIYNGFNKEYINSLNNNLQNNELFEIAYAGTIYPYQRLEVFLEGFRRFINVQNNPKIKILFYGIDFIPEQKQRILSYKQEINQYIQTTKRLSQKRVLQKLNTANLLLLLANESRSYIIAKVFDYLALNKKILLVVNDNGSLEKIINETNAGIICENSDDVYNHLTDLYSEFLKNKKYFW